MKKVRRETKSKLIMIRMSEGMYRQVLEQSTKKHMNLQEYVRYLLIREADKVSSYIEEY